MAELNIKQIEDKLNDEFLARDRRIVFWYDEKKEFIEDIDKLKLDRAKIHILEEGNLFKTKVILERKDPSSNYLIYAPFKEPNIEDNHLADTLKYSKRFHADWTSMMMETYRIDSNYKKTIEKHVKFFRNKDRVKKFEDLNVFVKDRKDLELALIGALTDVKVLNFDEMLKNIITKSSIEENDYLNELEKYNLEDAFWANVSKVFAYRDENPNLEKLLASLFISYSQRSIKKPLSKKYDNYILDNVGTVVTFLDQIMNSRIYRSKFNELSAYVYKGWNLEEEFNKMHVEDYLDLDLYPEIDEKIIAWIIDMLVHENLTIEADGKDIVTICEYRLEKNYGREFKFAYKALINAYKIIEISNYKPNEDLKTLVNSYKNEDYKIDSYYRGFYFNIDKYKNREGFSDLVTKVENIYNNVFLDPITKAFSKSFNYAELMDIYSLQKNFYRDNIEHETTRQVVIISDALRYEVAKELNEDLNEDIKLDSKLDVLLGVLPSYTSLGMAALLPHDNELLIKNDYRVEVAGMSTRSLVEREKILKKKKENSLALNFDKIKDATVNELKEYFQGKSVVYIYHNRIDAIGDNRESEHDVFNACKETIGEIKDLIRKLTNAVSQTSYLITADHGFIYKRSRLEEHEKLENLYEKEDFTNKRFVLSSRNYNNLGVESMKMEDVLFNPSNELKVYYPKSSNIFKQLGGGQNFVHGGASPQELLVPLIKVKSSKGKIETKAAEISILGDLSLFTSLEIGLEVLQNQPISDGIKEAVYKVYFVEELDERDIKISNEEILIANSRKESSGARISKLKFKLRDQNYNRDRAYYLIIKDSDKDFEIQRKRVVLDIIN